MKNLSWDDELFVSEAKNQYLKKSPLPKRHMTIDKEDLILKLYQTGNFTPEKLAKMYKTELYKVNNIISS